MAFTDGFGEWKDLGLISEIGDDWLAFPLLSETNHSTLRAIYYGDFAKIREWRVSLWIRALYYSGDQYFRDENWKRLYPKEQQEIIWYPFPRDLIKDPPPPRIFQVKRRLFYRRKPFIDAAPNPGLQLHEKLDTNAIYN